MKLFGIIGWSGSGKTTLIAKLLPKVLGHGLSVSTIKHARRYFDINQPTDNNALADLSAGAHEVMISSSERWALLHENRDQAEPDLKDLISFASPVDLLLIEGFKYDFHPRLEVHRPSIGKPLICNREPGIVAIASDEKLTGCAVPVFNLNDAEAITNFILEYCGLASRSPYATGDSG
jgi:molybdopterin-guanine dinucleotide biosynthesis protein B